jgi:hypothetical protein
MKRIFQFRFLANIPVYFSLRIIIENTQKSIVLSRGSSVRIETRLRAGRPEFNSRKGQ